MPVEIKSRVSPHSQENSRYRLRRFLGEEIYYSHQKYYLQLNASDSKLYELLYDEKDKKRVNRELYQMLHHVYTYGMDKCLLLIGNHTAFNYAVEVTFPQSIIASYNDVIETLYSKHYAFLYKTEFSETSFPCDNVKKALESLNQGRKEGDHVSWHAFLTNYRLWRALNVEPDERAIRFPLPTIDKFLPCHNAEWNLSKGPSDTLTKLFDGSEEAITIRTPQTMSIARFLVVLASAYHRCNQIMTAKEDFTKYKTLGNFRKAASKRATFKASMVKLTNSIWADMEAVNKQQQILAVGLGKKTSRVMLQEIPPSPQSRTRKQASAPTQHWNVKWHEGVTPSKKPGRPGEDKKRQMDQHCQRREDCLGFVPCVRVSSERKRCELCRSWTSFYCSGCRSHLCFQVGTKTISTKKMSNICKTLKLPDDSTIPKYNKMTTYDPKTKQKTGQDW